MATRDSTNQHITCALCLEIFHVPRLLPCSHTFCEKCLQQLLEVHSNATFPCPCCRENIIVPPGGVSHFKLNHYIDPEYLERARNGLECSKHPRDKLQFFCLKCNLAICSTCKSTTHSAHDTEELIAKDQLLSDKIRLETKIDILLKNVEEAQKELKELDGKKDVVQENICKRHASMVSEANKYRDGALASLNSIYNEIQKEIASKLLIYEKNMDSLMDIHSSLTNAINSGSQSEMLHEAKEMKKGRGREVILDRLIKNQLMDVSRPVLHYKEIPDTFFVQMRDFIGSPVRIDMTNEKSEDEVTERFQCGENEEVCIYSLCPLDNGNVWVSFEQTQTSGATNPKMFNKDGLVVNTEKKLVGKVSYKSLDGNKTMCLYPIPGKTQTYVKSKKRLLLCVDDKGTGHIQMMNIKSNTPFQSVASLVFYINCRRQRAVDANDSATMFAVVEEGIPPENQRTVSLYSPPDRNAIDTYTSPLSPWQPSDVCFYNTGKEETNEVLLVADELNDTIHMLRVGEEGKLIFARFIAPGCPLLLQPTALNKDVNDCIWVGCRRGLVLSCKIPKDDSIRGARKDCRYGAWRTMRNILSI